MSASGSPLVGWILTPPQQARQAYSRRLCSLPRLSNHLPRYINHLPRYISRLPRSFRRLSRHTDPLSRHPTSTRSLDCPPCLLDPLPHLLDPLARPLDPLLCLLDPLLCCPHPLLRHRHFPPLHPPPLFSRHVTRLRDPARSQTMNSSAVPTRPSARSLLIASSNIHSTPLLSTQRWATGETSLSLISSTFALTCSITCASTSSICSEMDTADVGRSPARCCGTHRASQSNARSCAQHVGLFFFLCTFALGLTHFLTGRGLRYCSFRPYMASTHSFTSRQAMAISPHTATPHVASLSPTDDAHVEVFQKTLAFYCALVVKGCAFSSAVDFPDLSDMIEQENNPQVDADDDSPKDSRKRKIPNCYSTLKLRYDSYNQPYIQYVFCFLFLCVMQHAYNKHSRCSQRSPDSPGAHLLLRNLQEFDIPYLRALLEDDSKWYLHVESHAKSLGIGPLAPCTFATSPVKHKAHCRMYTNFIIHVLSNDLTYSIAYWHRDEDNRLYRGPLRLSTLDQRCTTTYDIFVPENLHDCPRVLVLSTNPHNHPPPLPIKTPAQIMDCLESLLLQLEWKLADATPRRLALNSGFMHSLRNALGWTNHECDPSLHDIHPSLGNLDHLRCLINRV